MADIQTIAINAAIVGANILGTSVVSAVSNTICNKKIVKKIDVDKYEGNYEKYEKDYKKAKAKSALISTLVTVTSAVAPIDLESPTLSSKLPPTEKSFLASS